MDHGVEIMSVKGVAVLVVAALVCLAALVLVLRFTGVESFVALIYCGAFLFVGFILGFIIRGVRKN